MRGLPGTGMVPQDHLTAQEVEAVPTDLTRRPLKSRPAARDILCTLATGQDGTPMLSYHLVLDDAELWDLADYVESLGGPLMVTEDERQGRHVVRMHHRAPR